MATAAMMEHARSHRPTFKSTRNSRIRYDLSSVIRRRRKDKQAQRAQAAQGRYVVGRFVCDGDAIAFEGIEWQPGWWIDERAPLTRKVSKLARWRTRQAARQWLLRHFDPCLELVNLAQLRGREDDSNRGRGVAASTTRPLDGSRLSPERLDLLSP